MTYVVSEMDDISEYFLSWFGIFSEVIIGIVNLPILWMIKKEIKLTMINLMVTVDCLTSLCNIPIVIILANDFQQFSCSTLFSCGIMVTYSYFLSILNRLLPVGIVFYRYVYVCKNSVVSTGHQRKLFDILICSVILFFCLILSVYCFIYKDKYRPYLECIGMLDGFEDRDTINVVWMLPIFHPFRLLSILAFFSQTVLTPVGYYSIYVFRRNQDSQVKGLTVNSRIARKKRNIVTVKFNFLIWLAETSSFLGLIPDGKPFYVCYFLISCGLCPLLYYFGISDNRKTVRDYFKKLP
jgi:hypothetical protein